MNIVEIIREETRLHLDKTALIEGARTITYGELLAAVDALSGRLRARGLGAGQRVAFHSHDGIDYVIGALGLLGCGVAVVPVADSLTPDEIRETEELIDVSGMLVHTRMVRQAEAAASEKLDEIFVWQGRVAGSGYDERCKGLGAAFIRFSSGTTGASKGVLLSHRTIQDRTDAANEGLGISERDVILWVLGMSHHFVVSILLFLRKGATIVVANQNFPFSVVEAAGKFPITFIYGSPVHYYLLAGSKAVTAAALGQVRMAISTAMKMPADISGKFLAKFGFSPREAYGIIEIGLPFINTDSLGAGQNTVGRVLPAYQLKIADADEEGVGAVMVKGKGMFDAYFSPWRVRGECLKDGWFDTGDLGRVDEAGRLSLLGRTKTVIVCAGMKVFPEEVEEVINAVAGVKGSLVSGQEHPQFGQVPVAQVVLAGNVEDAERVLGELRGHCCRRLSSYKVPMRFLAVADLPRTASGKLARGARGWNVRNIELRAY